LSKSDVKAAQCKSSEARTFNTMQVKRQRRKQRLAPASGIVGHSDCLWDRTLSN